VPETRRSNYRKYDTWTPFSLKAYVFLHSAALVCLATGFLTVESRSPWSARIAGAALVLWTVAEPGRHPRGPALGALA